MEFNQDEVVYASPPLPPATQRNFLAGPGEGVSFHAISLNFEGVVRVEGTLLRFVPAVGRVLTFAKRQHQRFSP